MVLDRKKFSEEQPAMNTDELVFLDESGVSTALSNGFAWSKAGEKAVLHAPIHAKRLTIIGAIAADGLRGKMEVEGSMDGQTFKRFLDEQLGPNLRKGDVVDGSTTSDPSSSTVARTPPPGAEVSSTSMPSPVAR